MTPRDLEVVGDELADPCELTCVPSGTVPTSYSFLPQPFGGNYTTGVLARSRDGTKVYTIFQSGGPGSGGSSYEPGGGSDSWARVWTQTGGGWGKGGTIYAATRGITADTTGSVRAAGADPDGWIHLVYERRVVPPSQSFSEGPAPTLNYWTNADRDIYYTTHDEAAAPGDWGWEIPLVDIDTVGVAYANVAFNDIGPHVVYSQYNPEEGNLDVFYLEGTYLGNSIASGNSATWEGMVLLDGTFTVEEGATLTIAAGTRVYFQTPEDVGTDPLLGVVIRGEVLAEGTAEAPVVFTSTKGAAAGEWGSLRFEGGTASRLEHVVLENADRPVVFAGGLCDLVHVSFVNTTSGNPEVSIEMDLTVPEGETWELTGPVTLTVVSGADGTGGVDDGRAEVIVKGMLDLDGTAGAVRFESEAGTAGSWYGLWLSASSALAQPSGTVEVADALAGISVPDPNDGDAFLAAVRGWVDLTEDNTDDVVYVAPPDRVTVWDAQLWNGGKVLPVDFLVAPAGTLQVAAGTVVTVQSGLGLEIRADGPIRAEGTSGSRVRLTASGASPSPGAWQGVRFLDGKDVDAVSRLDFVDFEYPVIGAQLDSLSGNLFQPRFTDCEQHEIYLDRDTRIPKGYEWNLVGPTTVRMLADQDLGGRGENPTRIEIVPNGAIRTQAGPSGERVRFTSTAEDSTNGDDWYGMTVFGSGPHGGEGIAEIRGAEFAYASFPLTFFFADSAEVHDTRFHHYAKDAVTDVGSDAVITGCRIERGAGLGASKGLVGIRSFGSGTTVRQDTVLVQWNQGIVVELTKSDCLSPPPGGTPMGTTVIEDCVVVGSSLLGAAPTGILARWVCRWLAATVRETKVQGWATGVRMNNSADVRVECNCIRGNGVGVDHRRELLLFSDDPGMNWLRRNNLEKNTSTNILAQKGPGNVAAFYAGRGDAAAGENRIVLGSYQAGVWNYNLYAPLVYDRTDSAHVNNWYDPNGSAFADSASIQAKNSAWWAEQDIQLAGHDTVGDPSCSTQPADCDTVGLGGVAWGGPGEGVADEEREAGAEVTGVVAEDLLPTVFRLAVPRPSPASTVTVVGFDVPSPGADRAELIVYDVRGRRVRVLLAGPLAAGRHSFAWDLRDEGGRRLAAGVYFIRARTAAYTRVERLVVLR